MAVRTDLNSFAGGEIADTLIRRKDTVKYQTALRRLRNMLSLVGGGVRKRTGLLFASLVHDQDRKSRLIPFQYSTDQGYILEFGHLVMRVLFKGAPVVETELIVTGISNTDPAIVDAPAHGYSTGDDVYVSGQLGMTQINGRVYKVTVIDGDSFSLDGIDATGYGVWTSNTGGVAGNAGGDTGGTPPGGEVVPAAPPAFEDFTPTERQAILSQTFTTIYGYPPTPLATAFMTNNGRVPEYYELYPELIQPDYNRYGGYI